LVQELADDGLDIAVACRMLHVSRSSFYDWRNKPLSPRDQENELLLKHIRAIHADSYPGSDSADVRQRWCPQPYGRVIRRTR